jgi:hypothetical protein
MKLTVNIKSVSILVFTVASVTFQFPATILVRKLGPRIMFSSITIAFGVVTMVSDSDHSTTTELLKLEVYGFH